MKTIRKLLLLLLGVCLLLPLASCSSDEYSQGEIELNCDYPYIPTDGEIVLTVTIDQGSAADYGAAFSPEISREDFSMPLWLQSKEFSVEYRADRTILLHFAGEVTSDFGENRSRSCEILVAPSAFVGENVVGHLYCSAWKPFLVMTDFYTAHKDDGYTLRFTIETRLTSVVALDESLIEWKNAVWDDDARLEVFSDAYGQALDFDISGLKKEDESKPFTLILKEDVFSIGIPIEIEIPDGSGDVEDREYLF